MLYSYMLCTLAVVAIILWLPGAPLALHVGRLRPCLAGLRTPIRAAG